MCGKGRFLLMAAGLVLSVGASLIFGFTDSGMHGSFYMAVCLLGIAMIYFSSRGMSENR